MYKIKFTEVNRNENRTQNKYINREKYYLKLGTYAS